MLHVGSRIRIKDNAYEGSSDPTDFEARGKIGTVVYSFRDGAWEVQTDDDEFYPLTEAELEEIEQNETVDPDTPEMHEIAAKIKALINQVGWDTGEEVLVSALDLVLVSEENGRRFYERPDGQLKLTFSEGGA